MFLGLRQLLRWETSSSAFEKSLSEGTDVAGMHKKIIMLSAVRQLSSNRAKLQRNDKCNHYRIHHTNFCYNDRPSPTDKSVLTINMRPIMLQRASRDAATGEAARVRPEYQKCPPYFLTSQRYQCYHDC